MLEIIVFLLALGADQAVKYWSMTVLAQMPQQRMNAIPGVFWFQYAENYADNVSFLRGRSIIMNIVRIAQFLLVLYLLIFQRKRMRPITRVALVLFLAGMLGNQINYLTMQFVPDMFVFAPFQGYVFNLADVFVLVSLVILIIRLLFFEGHDLVNWILGPTEKEKKEAEALAAESKADIVEVDVAETTVKEADANVDKPEQTGENKRE